MTSLGPIVQPLNSDAMQQLVDDVNAVHTQHAQAVFQHVVQYIQQAPEGMWLFNWYLGSMSVEFLADDNDNTSFEAARSLAHDLRDFLENQPSHQQLDACFKVLGQHSERRPLCTGNLAEEPVEEALTRLAEKLWGAEYTVACAKHAIEGAVPQAHSATPSRLRL